MTQSAGSFLIGNITPAAFTPATKQLTVTLRMSNAGGRQGCTVTLRGYLHRFDAN